MFTDTVILSLAERSTIKDQHNPSSSAHLVDFIKILAGSRAIQTTKQPGGHHKNEVMDRHSQNTDIGLIKGLAVIAVFDSSQQIASQTNSNYHCPEFPPFSIQPSSSIDIQQSARMRSQSQQ